MFPRLYVQFSNSFSHTEHSYQLSQTLFLNCGASKFFCSSFPMVQRLYVFSFSMVLGFLISYEFATVPTFYCFSFPMVPASIRFHFFYGSSFLLFQLPTVPAFLWFQLSYGSSSPMVPALLMYTNCSTNL